MKVKLNRMLALLLAALMFTALAAGCSGGAASSAAASNEPAASTAGAGSTAEPAADDGDKTITFWTNGTEDPDKSIWQWAADKFNEETDSGYVVEVIATQNDNYKQKLTVAMSSGECPDMYQHWSGGPMIEYINAGYAKPITEQFAAIEDRFMEGAIEQATYNDDIYCIPVLNCSLAGIFYNTEIFEQYGLEVPTTLTELEAVCDTLVENGIVPFALANATSWTGSMYYMYLATRMGGLEPFNEAVAGTGSFEADNFDYAANKILEWVDKGYFPQGTNGLDEDSGQSRQMIYKGEAAMELMGSWRIGNYLEDSPEVHAKMGMFPFPAIEDGKGDATTVVGTIGDGFISFNCTGAKLDAAIECVSYFSTDEGKQMMIDLGKYPPLKGVEMEDHLQQEVSAMLESATGVQLWYDQYLPPEVSEVHKQESQKLFDKSATAEEVNAAQQAAMQKYLDETA